jgi:DNA-binding CsgD family transcriptional regulator
MGKTRLLEEALTGVADLTVLAGACLPLSESLPYGALTDALTALTGPEGRGLLDRALARCAPFVLPQIAALVPALVVPGSGTLGPATPDRTALFSAVRELLAALAADRRTVLVVEDLHWADAGSLDLLTFLARRVPPGVAVIVSSRRGELAPDDRALAWQEVIMRDTGAEHVALRPLLDADVATLVTALAGPAVDHDLVAEVQRRGGGNPFFTEQLVASAHDARHRQDSAPVPETVAYMLLARVRSVSTDGAEVASVLAVAARPLTEAELRTCVDDTVDLATGVRELLDARLVEAAEREGYRLRHALLEDTVRETLLPSRRGALHARVAAALAGRTAEVAPAEIAAHWGRAGVRVEEARWSLVAARRAETLFAWREACASWRRVWDLWAEVAADERPPVTLAEVVVGCVEAIVRSGDEEAFAQLIERARGEERIRADDWAQARLLSAHAPFVGAWDKEAEIALRARAAEHYARTGRPSGQEADNLFRLADTRLRQGRAVGTEHEDRLAAVRIAEAAGFVGAQVSIGSNLAVERMENGEVDEGVADLVALLRLSQRGAGQGAVSAEQWTSVLLTDAYLWLLRLPDLMEAGRAGAERGLAHGLDESFASSILAGNLVVGLVLSGDVPAARTLAVPHGTSSLGRRWPLRLARAELDVLDGHPDGALQLVHEIRAEGLGSTELHLVLHEVESAAHLWSGRPQQAWDSAMSGLDGLRGDREAVRSGQLLAQAARAAADLADAGAGADRSELTGQLLARAKATGCLVPHPSRVLGAAYATTYAGELARLTREDEEAAWCTARDTWAGHGVPHHAAYAGWRLAELLLDAGRRAEAGSELAAAHRLAEGHVPLRHEIEGLARRARLALQEPPEPGRAAEQPVPDGLPYGLTPRELEVLRLLATGATNGEIGRRLYMSPKTASVHVTAILRKLGVRGRVQAATVAERMGLVDGDDSPAH